MFPHNFITNGTWCTDKSSFPSGHKLLKMDLTSALRTYCKPK